MGRNRIYHTEEERKDALRKSNRRYYAKNKKYFIDKAIRWGKENPEKLNSTRKKYENAHTFRRLMLRANCRHDEQIVEFDLWKIAKKQKLKCALTGDILTKKNISLDHIIPFFKGGRNIPSNLRLVTHDANFLKNTHSDKYLLDLCKKIVTTLS